MPVNSGVLIDGLYSVEYAIKNLALPPAASKKGSVTVGYSAPQAIQAKIEKNITKTGAQIDFYDPVLAALLAGEL